MKKRTSIGSSAMFTTALTAFVVVVTVYEIEGFIAWLLQAIYTAWGIAGIATTLTDDSALRKTLEENRAKGMTPGWYAVAKLLDGVAVGFMIWAEWYVTAAFVVIGACCVQARRYQIHRMIHREAIAIANKEQE